MAFNTQHVLNSLHKVWSPYDLSLFKCWWISCSHMQCLTSSVKATLDCGVIKKIRILSALKCKYGYHSFLHCQENLDNHQKYSLTAARSHFLLNYFLTLFNRGVRIQKAISINFSQSIRKNMTNFSSSLINCLTIILDYWM